MLTPQWFTGLDEKDGILRFDFVSSETMYLLDTCLV